MIRARNLAQARKEQFTLEAEGEAYAIKQKALAHAQAIHEVATVLGGDGASAAAQLNMAREVSSEQQGPSDCYDCNI